MQVHFEDAYFLELHQKLLRQKQYPDTGFVNKGIAPLSTAEQLEVEQLIKIKNEQHDTWGWKDPRTCLFLDTYHQLLPDAFYMVVVRNFNDTVSSLVTREFKMNEKRFQTKKGLSKLKWILFKRKSLEQIFKKETDQFLKIWICYYEQILSILKHLSNENFYFVSYDTLAENDINTFLQLKDIWGFDFKHIPFSTVFNRQFLSDTTDIAKYIKDKSLIERAISIEQDIAFNYMKQKEHNKIDVQ